MSTQHASPPSRTRSPANDRDEFPGFAKDHDEFPDVVFMDFLRHVLEEDDYNFEQGGRWAYTLHTFYIRFSRFCEERGLAMRYFSEFEAALESVTERGAVTSASVLISRKQLIEVFKSGGYPLPSPASEESESDSSEESD